MESLVLNRPYISNPYHLCHGPIPNYLMIPNPCFREPHFSPETHSVLDLSLKTSPALTLRSTTSTTVSKKNRVEEKNLSESYVTENHVPSTHLEIQSIKNNVTELVNKCTSEWENIKPRAAVNKNSHKRIDVLNADAKESKDVEKNTETQVNKITYRTKKSKIRKTLVDEDKTSPVSGTIIRDLRHDEILVVRKVFFFSIRILNN